MDYKNGKIYKILNTVDDDCYVGSTTQPLSKRMAKHRQVMNAETKRDRLLYTKMRILGVDKFYIELLECFPCDSIEQLRKREGHYIKELGTLNHLVAGRTKTEWSLEHAEQKKETDKQYYLENHDHILTRQKEYRENHKEEMKDYKKKHYEEHKTEILQKCKDKYNENKEHMLERNKLYRANHKDKIKEWESTTVVCSCGSAYTLTNKARHLKSLRHQNHEAKEQSTDD